VLRLCGDHELTADHKTISKVLKLYCANDLIVDHRTMCDVLKLSGVYDLTADHRTISDEHITLSEKTCTHFVQFKVHPSDMKSSQKSCAVHQIK
jgi:hypothetical protein